MIFIPRVGIGEGRMVGLGVRVGVSVGDRVGVGVTMALEVGVGWIKGLSTMY